MKEEKKLFLYLFLGALFIVAVGVLNNKKEGRPLFGNLNLPFAVNDIGSNKQTYRKLTVKDKNITVAIADDPEERRVGLSEHTQLPEDEGMLFILNRSDKNQSFWMKGMSISIDIIWIRDGKIIQIDKNAEPEPGVNDKNLKLYSPSQSVDYVLEVISGWSDRNDIQVGDSVEI